MDSSNACVYGYGETIGGDTIDVLYDSLSSRVGDQFYGTLRYLWFTCFSEDTSNIFGAMRPVKDFWISTMTIEVGGVYNVNYASGLGYVIGSFSPNNVVEGRSRNDSLVYARINGIEYGTPAGVLENQQYPAEYRLSQNYPNPFNPSTTITFMVSRSGFVSLKVYDVLGRLVRIQVNRVKSPGSYEVAFHASNLPSGVYFYRLIAEGHSITHKMVLIK